MASGRRGGGGKKKEETAAQILSIWGGGGEGGVVALLHAPSGSQPTVKRDLSCFPRTFFSFYFFLREVRTEELTDNFKFWTSFAKS